MALISGRQFSFYHIGEAIGVGGMGEVYRATDTNLKRDVAIKVLPESFAADADRLARFQREAEVLASLNHPNIAQIYGLERADNITALVMELIPGPTLADRLEQGPVPAEEAISIAMQIIEALTAAHERGIVHRDLKPANIKLKPDGTVKVLDFGIAKIRDLQSASGPHEATRHTPAYTETGIVLGTAAYMSPEQARGKTVDQRADIWAFGCVLYEMLTGQPAFGGEDVSITLARILERGADLNALPPMLAPAVKQTISLCLEKDLKKRIADVRDVRLALAGALESAAVPATAQRSSPLLFWLKALPVALVLAAALAGGVYYRMLPAAEAPRPVVRFVHEVPDDRNLMNLGPVNLDIAPDGRRLAYGTAEGLVVRELDGLDDAVIPAQRGIQLFPRFSSDGESLAFIRVGVSGVAGNSGPAEIARVGITGGAAISLAPLSQEMQFRELRWEADGTLLLSMVGAGIYRLGENGGEPELIVAVEADQDVGQAQLLPGGEWVLFTLAQGLQDSTRFDRAELVAQSLVTGERRSLRQGASSGRYASTGHLVYGVGNTLFAVAFDAATLQVSGSPVPVVQGVSREGAGVNQYAFSSNGTLVYMPGGAWGGQLNLVLGDDQGRVQALSVPAGRYANPRAAPDGRWIAFEAQYSDGSDIAVLEIGSTAAPRRLTFGGGNTRPVWSADGTRVAYASSRANGPGIYWRLADGSGAEESLTQATTGSTHVPEHFSPDGQTLAFTSASSDSRAIWQLALENGEASVLIESPGPGASHAVFSPDGRWLAYQAYDTGRSEIFVQPFPLTGAKYQLPSRLDNHHPVWSPDGRQLYYIPGPGSVERVDISTERGFSFGSPQVLELGALRGGAPLIQRQYDLLPDGSVLGLLPEGAASAGEQERIVVVLNWFEELKRLVPVE